jgi:hypothetical protein
MRHSGGVRPSTVSRRSSGAVLAALAITAVLLGGAKCEATSTAAPATSAGAQPGGDPGVTGNAAQQLAALRVAPNGTMTGYSRDRFPHWISQGGGCDTRDLVLKRDGQGVKATADCKITSGSWLSLYDQKTFADPGLLDVDHMVPLADAWRSGANKWTDDRRSQFANDLTRPQLLAVSANANRAKGDQDPSQWKPTSHAYWCTYAQRWIAVKSFWQLTVTQAEQSTLGDMLGTCT